MKFLAQYFVEEELITKILTGYEIIKLHGESDFNCVDNLTIFQVEDIGIFVPCKIVFSHTETVDDFGHRDIYCNIINNKDEILHTSSYEEH